MRERLIEIVKESLVKNIDYTHRLAENITDDLLAEGVIVPPCKLGDKVYEIWCVSPPTIMGYEVGCIVQKGTNEFSSELWQDAHGGVICNFTDVGKTVFLTREEAEKALEKMKGGGE